MSTSFAVRRAFRLGDRAFGKGLGGTDRWGSRRAVAWFAVLLALPLAVFGIFAAVLIGADYAVTRTHELGNGDGSRSPSSIQSCAMRSSTAPTRRSPMCAPLCKIPRIRPGGSRLASYVNEARFVLVHRCRSARLSACDRRQRVRTGNAATLFRGDRGGAFGIDHAGEAKAGSDGLLDRRQSRPVFRALHPRAGRARDLRGLRRKRARSRPRSRAQCSDHETQRLVSNPARSGRPRHLEPWLGERQHIGDFGPDRLDGRLAHGGFAAARHALGLSALDRDHRAPDRLLALRRLACAAQPKGAARRKQFPQRNDRAAVA